MRASLSITVSKVDLLAERSSCSLLWHWYVTVFSVLPPQHYKAGDPDPSKDLQLAEFLRSRVDPKGFILSTDPTPKSQELKHTQFNTPALPLPYWPHMGWPACGVLEEERSWAALQQGECANLQLLLPAESQSNPVTQAWSVTCVYVHPRS